jgi:TatA/E family protein of Tat protein translocase
MSRYRRSLRPSRALAHHAQTTSHIMSSVPPKSGTIVGMPGWIGVPELIVLLLVLLLIFGPKRLPEMGRSLGKGMREFKDTISGKGDDDDERALPRGDKSDPVGITPREHDSV